MAAVVPLRPDFDATKLRGVAKRCPDSRQTRRLLALAAVYEGMSRAEAAKVGGMDRQTLRDWVHRFNEEGMDGGRPLVAEFVELCVEGFWHFAVGLGRNDVYRALFPDQFSDPVGILGLVSQHRLSRLQLVQEHPANRRVMGPRPGVSLILPR